MAYVDISFQTLGSAAASVTFTDIPAAYQDLRLEILARGDTSATNVAALMTLNGDTGTNYRTQINRANNATASVSASVSATPPSIASLTAATGPTDRAGRATLHLPHYADTTFHKSGYSLNYHLRGTTTAGNYLDYYAWWWDSTDAIDEIVLTASAGNFAAGSRFRLYGHL
jgi:hypothetical protein